MEKETVKIENLERLRFLLDLPELSYFPQSYIYAVLNKEKTRIDFVAPASNLSPKEILLSKHKVYSVSAYLKDNVGVFLNKESARLVYTSVSTWAQAQQFDLVLMEYKNDKLLKLLCVNQKNPEERIRITQELEAVREKYWLEETAPKVKMVIPDIDVKAFNESTNWPDPTQIQHVDPNQKKVKAFQHKI